MELRDLGAIEDIWQVQASLRLVNRDVRPM